MGNIEPAKAEEPLGLGLSLTALQLAVYFTFILLACFAAPSLATVVPGIGLPLSFVLGLAVIACGTLLTILYVVRANAAESVQS